MKDDFAELRAALACGNPDLDLATVETLLALADASEAMAVTLEDIRAHVTRFDLPGTRNFLAQMIDPALDAYRATKGASHE